MQVTDSIKYIAYFTKVFGILPFQLESSTGSLVFRESRLCVAYSVAFFSVVIILQGVYILRLVFFPEFGFLSAPEVSSKALVVLAFATSFLCLPFTCVVLIKENRSFCCWLNRLPTIFSNLSDEDVKRVRRMNVGLSVSSVLGMIVLVALQFATMPGIYEKNNPFFGIPFIEVFVADQFIALIENKIFFQFFLVLVNMLRSYLAKVNEILDRDADSGDRNLWMKHVRDVRLSRLEVGDFLAFLHSFFVPAVALQLLWEFYGSLFNVMISSKYGFSSTVSIMWTIYYLWDYFAVALMCHLAEKEAEQTINCINKFFMSCDDAELKEELEIISLQLQHQRVRFYAPGNIKLDLSLMYRSANRQVIGSLTSYAVILKQFQEPPRASVCYKTIAVNCSATVA